MTECRICRTDHPHGAFCPPLKERTNRYIGELRKAAGLCPDCRRDHKCADHATTDRSTE